MARLSVSVIGSLLVLLELGFCTNRVTIRGSIESMAEIQKIREPR